MFHPKRPTASLYVLATVICTVGTIAVSARILHNNTRYTLVEPFSTITFIYGATYAVLGPAIGAALTAISLRGKLAALKAEIAALRARQRTYDTLVEHVQKADAQVEVTTVLCRKILSELASERASAETQPIANLRSINGGGGA